MRVKYDDFMDKQIRKALDGLDDIDAAIDASIDTGKPLCRGSVRDGYTWAVVALKTVLAYVQLQEETYDADVLLRDQDDMTLADVEDMKAEMIGDRHG